MKRSLWLLALLTGCSENGFTPRDEGEIVPDDTGVPIDTDRPADTDVPEDTEETETEETETEEPDPTGPPVADAGADIDASPLDNVRLDGSDSYDPQGLDPLTYKWSVVSRPAGSTALMLTPNQENPRFWVDIAGDYVLELGVKNTVGTWDPTPDRVTIHAIPSRDFYVQLTWSAAVDLDLHVLESGGTLFDEPSDVCFCNQESDWGTASSADDPSLDWDSISGYGPETTTIEAPAAGSYDVRVHYYGRDGNTDCGTLDNANATCPSTTATVKIFFDGVEIASYSHALNDHGDVWNVARIDWPAATPVSVNTMTSTTSTSCF